MMLCWGVFQINQIYQVHNVNTSISIALNETEKRQDTINYKNTKCHTFIKSDYGSKPKVTNF